MGPGSLIWVIPAKTFNQMTRQVSGRTRELKKLEELGRAILNGPPDASILSEILGEHVSLMFPHSRLEIRVFPDQTFLRHPDDRQPVAASAWEWLTTQSEAQHFLPGEVPPWDTQAADDALVVAPILDVETKEPIGGIHLSLRRDPDAASSLLPAVQSCAAQIASALHGARVYAKQLAHESVSRELALAGQIQFNLRSKERTTLGIDDGTDAPERCQSAYRANSATVAPAQVPESQQVETPRGLLLLTTSSLPEHVAAHKAYAKNYVSVYGPGPEPPR